MIPRGVTGTSHGRELIIPHTIILVSRLGMANLLNCHDRSIKHPGNVFSRYEERPGHPLTFFKRDAIRLSIKSYISSWRSFPVPRRTLKGLKELTELKWQG